MKFNIRDVYQVGGLISGPSIFRPKQQQVLDAAEQGRQEALSYMQSPLYKRNLRRELRKSDYGTQTKPTFDQLYNERLGRVQNDRVTSIRSNNAVAPLADYGYHGLNFTTRGGQGKILNTSHINTQNDISTLSEKPSGTLEKQYARVGMEEVLHGSHVPKTLDSATGRYMGDKQSLGTFKNITPFAQQTIQANTAKAGDFDASVGKGEQVYWTRPTEILTQLPQLRQDFDVKGNFGRKDFKNMVKNPTGTSERMLRAITGKEDPFKALQSDKKLYNKARKSMKQLGKLADNSSIYNPNDTIARDGTRTKVASDQRTAIEGLKNPNYDSMYFPRNGRAEMQMTMKGMKDPIYYAGVSDDGRVLQEGIAYPGEDFKVQGNVFEQRLKAQNGMKFNINDLNRPKAQFGFERINPTTPSSTSNNNNDISNLTSKQITALQINGHISHQEALQLRAGVTNWMDEETKNRILSNLQNPTGNAEPGAITYEQIQNARDNGSITFGEATQLFTNYWTGGENDPAVLEKALGKPTTQAAVPVQPGAPLSPEMQQILDPNGIFTNQGPGVGLGPVGKQPTPANQIYPNGMTAAELAQINPNQLDMDLIEGIAAQGIQGGAAGQGVYVPPIDPNSIPEPASPLDAQASPATSNTNATNTPSSGSATASNTPASTSVPTPNNIAPIAPNSGPANPNATQPNGQAPLYDPNRNIVGWRWRNPDGSILDEEMLSKKDARKFNRQRRINNGNANLWDKAVQGIQDAFAIDPQLQDERDRIKAARKGIRDANKQFRLDKRERNLVTRANRLEEIQGIRENRNNVSNPALDSRQANQIYKNSMRNSRANEAMESRWQKKLDREVAKAERNVKKQEALARLQGKRLDNNEQANRISQQGLTNTELREIEAMERAGNNRQANRALRLAKKSQAVRPTREYGGNVFHGNEPFNVSRIPETGYFDGQRKKAQTGLNIPAQSYGFGPEPDYIHPSLLQRTSKPGDSSFNVNDQEIKGLAPSMDYSNNLLVANPTPVPPVGQPDLSGAPRPTSLPPTPYSGPDLEPIYGDPKAKQQTKQRQMAANTGGMNKGMFGNLSDDAWVQLAGEFLPATYNLIESAKRPAWYAKETNTGLQKGLQALRSTDTRVDRTGMQSAFTGVKHQLDSQHGSAGSQQANKLAAYNRMLDQERMASQQEAQNRQQLAMQIAQQEGRIGADAQQARLRQIQMNDQAELARDMLRNKAVTQFGTGIVDVGRQMGNAAQNEFEWQMMGQMYAKYAPADYQRFIRGEISWDELIQFRPDIAQQAQVAATQQSKKPQHNVGTVKNVQINQPGISATETTYTG